MKPRSDAALRQMAPKPVMELLIAYETAAKRTVTLDHMRVRALSEIARRDYTGDDMRMVVRYVRNRVAKQPKTHGMKSGFSDASIGCQNLWMDVNKFEDRLLEAREAVLHGRRRRTVMAAQACGNGVTTLVEGLAPQADTTARSATKKALREMMEGL